jgi:hypothetical protein
MRRRGPARRLTVFIGASDRYEHHSLCNEIVQRAQRAGLAGCDEGLAVVDDVEVVRYGGRAPDSESGGG